MLLDVVAGSRFCGYFAFGCVLEVCFCDCVGGCGLIFVFGC